MPSPHDYEGGQDQLFPFRSGDDNASATGGQIADDVTHLSLDANVHSLGGLVTLAALGTGKIAPPRALVLAATSVWLGGDIGRRTIMAAYRGVTALFGKAPIRALRAGTADEARSYVAQLTGWSRSGRWLSLAGVDYLTALETIEVPTLALTGAGDWMCKPGDAAAISGRIRSARPLRIVGRAHGDPLDPDHFQLFTRPELGGVRDEIGRFVRT